MRLASLLRLEGQGRYPDVVRALTARALAREGRSTLAADVLERVGVKVREERGHGEGLG